MESPVYSKKMKRLFKQLYNTDDPKTVTAEMLVNFGELLGKIDEIFIQQDDRLKVALRNIELSSSELNHVNVEMERLNTSLRTILESLGEGLFFFGKDGVCDKVFSNACIRLLEKEPANLPVWDVLGLTGDDQTTFQSLTDIIFNIDRIALPFHTLMDQAPHRFVHSKGLDIRLDYRAIKNSRDEIIAVLVIASDEMEIHATQEKFIEQKKTADRIMKVAGDRNGYLKFLRSTKDFIDVAHELSGDDLKRNIHTLKSIARFYGLDALAVHFHHIEDKGHLILDDLEGLRADVQAGLTFEREVSGSTNTDQEISVSVSAKKIRHFGMLLQDLAKYHPNAQEVSDRYWGEIIAHPVRDLLLPFRDQIKYFTEMDGKEVDIVFNIDSDLRVDPEKYGAFFDSLVHVARNMAVYAAEPATIRGKRHLPSSLQVHIQASKDKNEGMPSLLLKISDDGAGVNLPALRQKIASKIGEEKAKILSDEEALQYIFAGGMSTSTKITEIAGRGVGLNAVAKTIKSLGGSITVSSQIGKGTVFSITLPLGLFNT